MLQNLRRICSPGALLEVILGLDPERDRTEVERLGLEPLSVAYIDSTLSPRYGVVLVLGISPFLLPMAISAAEDDLTLGEGNLLF